MLRKSILRATTRPQTFLRKTPPRPRNYATEPPKSPPTAQSRIERFNRRLPKFLHRYTNALANAPLSHITSFLILHELTAIIPLFGLAGFFHYTHWLPPWFAEGAWIASGVERFGRYFRRKGWIRSEDEVEANREMDVIQRDAAREEQLEREGLVRQDGDAEEAKRLRKVDKAWMIGEGGVRVVVEFATAYAIVKMLLVPRIMFSAWATPWFARMTVLPVLGRFKRAFGGAKKAGSGSAAGGTGAVDAGVVSKSSKKGS